MSKPRIAHCRFYKNKPQYNLSNKFDRVVTTAWKFDEETHILSYAATVYKENSDFWIKKLHTKEALDRFARAPLKIYLNGIGDFSKFSLDWYIARNLIYKFGAYDVANESIERTCLIRDNFINKYDPTYCHHLERTPKHFNCINTLVLSGVAVMIPVLCVFIYLS